MLDFNINWVIKIIEGIIIHVHGGLTRKAANIDAPFNSNYEETKELIDWINYVKSQISHYEGL